MNKQAMHLTKYPTKETDINQGVLTMSFQSKNVLIKKQI